MNKFLKKDSLHDNQKLINKLEKLGIDINDIQFGIGSIVMGILTNTIICTSEEAIIIEASNPLNPVIHNIPLQTIVSVVPRGSTLSCNIVINAIDGTKIEVKSQTMRSQVNAFITEFKLHKSFKKTETENDCGSLTCASCGGPVPINSKKCPFCGTLNSHYAEQQQTFGNVSQYQSQPQQIHIEVSESGPRCPRCGSTNVSAKYGKKKSGIIKKSMATVATGGLNIAVGATAKAIKGGKIDMVCLTCHKEFTIK